MGRTSDGTLLLADEITPDSCRLWDHAAAWIEPHRQAWHSGPSAGHRGLFTALQRMPIRHLPYVRMLRHSASRAVATGTRSGGAIC